MSEARRHLNRLHCYAALKSDEDTRVGTYQAMRQEVELLGTELARREEDATEAEQLLREAHRLYTEMGASGHAQRLAAELGL